MTEASTEDTQQLLKDPKESTGNPKASKKEKDFPVKRIVLGVFIVLLIVVIVIMVVVFTGNGNGNVPALNVGNVNSPLPQQETINGVMGRYVRIERQNDVPWAAYLLNLAELRVIGPNLDQAIVSAGNVTQSSIWRIGNTARFGANNLVDDSLNTMSHTGQGDTMPWIELDLGAEYDITQIIIENRRDGSQERAVGLQVFIKNAAEKTVWSSDPISDIAPTYIFDISSTERMRYRPMFY